MLFNKTEASKTMELDIETFSEVDNSGVDADYFTAEADTGGIDGIDGFG